MLKAATGEVISVTLELEVCPIVCLAPDYLTVAMNRFFLNC